MKSDFPETRDFFGSYFHQDWLEEHDTADQVIDDFLSSSDQEILILFRSELQALLNLKIDEMNLRAFFFKEMHCYYCYWNEWTSGEIWLRHIEKKLNDSLADPHLHP
ncbi:contact-dependent growth inhibition system immunity protein [Pseudomonas fluorescens]|uniref:contact-dependent growth inhibition system immunity protein n=1 Tax=Pseudomonas fluorescens TaxID=294 RepID=UPI003749DB95